MMLGKKQSYPSPCETCEKAESCKMGYGCADWQIRYRYRQKQINAYARKQREEYFQSRFVYQHPNEVRNYLRKWPCGECDRAEDCDIPCTKYLQWYDARMQVAKMKLTKEN